MKRFISIAAACCIAGSASSATLGTPGINCGDRICGGKAAIGDHAYKAEGRAAGRDSSGNFASANGGRGGMSGVLVILTDFDVIVRPFGIPTLENNAGNGLLRVIDLTSGRLQVRDSPLAMPTRASAPYKGDRASRNGRQANIRPDGSNLGSFYSGFVDTTSGGLYVTDLFPNVNSQANLATIPLPAGGALLVTGLLGLGIARHRKG